ncbi:MAG: DUF4175 family protein [bacterium]
MMEIRGEKAYYEIRSRLDGLRRREKFLILFSGGLLCLAVLLGTGWIGLALEAVFRFTQGGRLVFVSGLVFVGIVVIGIWIGRPLYSLLFRKETPDDDRLALRVGEVFPHIKDKLADGLQVFRLRTCKDYGTSDSLAVASLEKMHEAIANLDFRRVITNERLYRSLRILGFVTAGCLFCLCIFPGAFGSAFERMGHPRKDYPKSSLFRIDLRPGNVRVVQGEDVEIVVAGEGSVPQEISLFLQGEGEEEREVVLRKPFKYRIPSIRSGLDYFAEAKKVRTEVYRIEVVQRPMVRTLEVKLFPPSYARLGVRVLEPNAGNVEALKGTRVDVSVWANKILSDAAFVFGNGEEKKMACRGREAAGDFIVEEDDRYRIELTDTLGIGNADPIVYWVRVQPDLSPMARILSPGGQMDLDDTMTLPLMLEGEDDFGLSSCRLGFWIQRSGSSDSSAVDTTIMALPFEKGEPARVLINHTWDMEPMGLLPEDVVTYFFEVLDNDRVSGPKRGRSRMFTVRFPSIYEIFREVEAEQSNQVGTLTEIFTESQDLQEELERISEEMKIGGELEWEERKNLEKTTETQQSLKERIDGLKQRLDETVDRMERNDLLSLETLLKYEELQKLYEEIASPELTEAMKKLQEAISRVSQDELKNATERFKMSQEQFLKSIDRTISLLKRLRVEQKVDELVKRTDDLVQRQGEVNEELARADEGKASELGNKERGIKRDAEALRKEMEGVLRQMEELPDMPLSALKAAMDEMDRQNLLERLENIVEAMDHGQMEGAASEGVLARSTMSTLSEMLKKMQNSLQGSHKEKVAGALRRASRRLLQLSEGQEDVMSGMSSGRTTGTEATDKQLSLLTGLAQVVDSLVQLSQETFSITQDMGLAMGEAKDQMGKALQLMEQSGGRGASAHQGNAMGALNRTVMAIQDALGRFSGSESGLGTEEFFFQMEQMAMQQMGINQQTLDFFQRGQLTMEEQASMARLAAEQEAVKNALEKLAEEIGRRSDIAGRLDGMVGDMDAVVREMKASGTSREMIRRQERILSRLLDTQRSVRRRDTSRERQARSGRDFIRTGPQALPVFDSEWKDRLRRDILRMAKEGYTKDFQGLIRKYYEALTREEKQ